MRQVQIEQIENGWLVTVYDDDGPKTDIVRVACRTFRELGTKLWHVLGAGAAQPGDTADLVINRDSGKIDADMENVV